MSPVRRLNRRGVVNAKVIRKWSRCSDAERYLQNGLSRFFVRVPTRAQPASSAGCTVHGTADEKSELGARPGHQRLFRWAFPRMAGEVRRASGGGPARRAAHPEMVESRRAGGWETNTCGGRGAPERWMAVANALGQRGSKCVTAAPWKSPLMAWSTVCDDYFRVADNSLGAKPELSGMSRLRSGPSTLEAWVQPFRRTTLQLRLRTPESAAALSPGTVPSTIRTSKDRKQLASPMRQLPNPYRP